MSANRFIQKHGRKIPKKDYTQTGTDPVHGDPQYSESTVKVNAVYELGRANAIDVAETGVKLTNTADIYLPSTVSVDGPSAQRPSVFILSNNEYKVVSKENQQDLIYCHCEQKTI